jgi:hypothetical protein
MLSASRGGAFILTVLDVLARLTLWNTENKKLCYARGERKPQLDG